MLRHHAEVAIHREHGTLVDRFRRARLRLQEPLKRDPEVSLEDRRAIRDEATAAAMRERNAGANDRSRVAAEVWDAHCRAVNQYTAHHGKEPVAGPLAGDPRGRLMFSATWPGDPNKDSYGKSAHWLTAGY